MARDAEKETETSGQSPIPPLNQQKLAGLTYTQLVNTADQLLDQTLDRMRRAETPLWEHEAQMGRTVITLASGGLIASVSVAQFLADKVEMVAWGWLVPCSWILWAWAILAGITRELWIGRARSFAYTLEQGRGALRVQIQQLEGHHTVQDVEDLILAWCKKADEEPAKARRGYSRLNQVVYWTFAGGLGGLIVFAIKNLPF